MTRSFVNKLNIFSLVEKKKKVFDKTKNVKTTTVTVVIIIIIKFKGISGIGVKNNKKKINFHITKKNVGSLKRKNYTPI